MSIVGAAWLLEDLVRKPRLEVYRQRASLKAPAEIAAYNRTKPAFAGHHIGSRVRPPHNLTQAFPARAWEDVL
jgi:hypothetical protein